MIAKAHHGGQPLKASAEIVKSFFEAVGHLIPEDATVLLSSEEIDPKSIRTALDRLVDFGIAPKRGFLLFIDTTPDANWGHDCVYVFLSTGGSVFCRVVDWPPHESISMTPLKIG